MDPQASWYASAVMAIGAALLINLLNLLLIEAERTLGDVERADELITDLKKHYDEEKRRANRCRFGQDTDAWRMEMTKALGEIEQRELKCVNVAPGWVCPA